MTMWLETMIESAMDSRMIIEVADENPPMKANSASPSWPAASGSGEHEHVGVRARRHDGEPEERDGQDEQAHRSI